MQRRFARYAAVLLAAPLVLLGVQSAPQSVSVASKAPSASTVAKARANFIKDMSAHATALGGGNWTSPTAEHAGKATAANGTVSETPSYNWSGYADSESGTKTVTYVSGNWTMPSVTCPTAPYQNSDAFLANWVGVDGFNDATVEQLGTAAQCFEGVTYYYVWYEMYPADPVYFSNTVKPGDKFSASVTFSGTETYTLVLKDTTQGWTQTITKNETGLDRSSAEVITEAPSSESGVLPLADFGTVSYSASAANGTSLGGQSPTEIIMIDNSNRDKDSTSAIGSGGAFSNTWIRAN